MVRARHYGVLNSGIKDYQASARPTQANLKALGKIGKDYADSYRCKNMSIHFKEPGKIRFEMSALFITFTYVINGNTKYTSVPALHINKTMDISQRPQTRQGSMELGFLTQSALDDFHPKFLRDDGKAQVWELRFKQKDLQDRKMDVWVDPDKKVMTRRDLFLADGSLKARFTYTNPKEVAPGLWVPTRITVHNAQGELAGTTLYNDIRVNKGMSDSLFKGI